MLHRTATFALCLVMVGCTSTSGELTPCELFGAECGFEVQSCYLFTVANEGEGLVGGDAICLRTGQRGQGEECTLMNQCSEGHGCILGKTSTDTTLVCAQYCDFDRSLGGADCAAGFECRQISETYGNTQDVPDAIGFCVPDGWES